MKEGKIIVGAGGNFVKELEGGAKGYLVKQDATEQAEFVEDTYLNKTNVDQQTVEGVVDFVTKVISPKLETDGSNTQISQRVELKAYGNKLSISNPVEESEHLGVNVPFDRENASTQILVPRVGDMQSLTFQPIDTDTFTGTEIIIPTVTAGGIGAVTSVLTYKFATAGIKVRQRTIATNPSGKSFDIYGTSADPWLYFTSEVGETRIELPSPIPNSVGTQFDSVIESVDDVPLDILGNAGVIVPLSATPFAPWAHIEFQDFEETELNTSDISELDSKLDDKAELDGSTLTNATVNGVELKTNQGKFKNLDGDGNYLEAPPTYGQLMRSSTGNQKLKDTKEKLDFNAVGDIENLGVSTVDDRIVVLRDGSYDIKLLGSAIIKKNVRYTIYIRINGAIDYEICCPETAEDNDCYPLTGGRILPLVASDYIELWGYCDSGMDKDFKMTTGTDFSVVKV